MAPAEQSAWCRKGEEPQDVVLLHVVLLISSNPDQGICNGSACVQTKLLKDSRLATIHT